MKAGFICSAVTALVFCAIFIDSVFAQSGGSYRVTQSVISAGGRTKLGYHTYVCKSASRHKADQAPHALQTNDHGRVENS